MNKEPRLYDYIIENIYINNILKENEDKHLTDKELYEKLKDINIVALYKKIRYYYDNERL
jgi:hypothetical protein